MKAIKINKIQWNLNGMTEEEKAKIIATLPTFKGFMAQDDFCVTEKVPALLKKHYGVDVETFSFVECRIADNVENLLRICAPTGYNDAEMFTETGKLSKYGKKAKENLISNIKWRTQLENQGTAPSDMPKILDEVMLSLEKITGLKWDENTHDKLMTPVLAMIFDMRKKDDEIVEEEEDEVE